MSSDGSQGNKRQMKSTKALQKKMESQRAVSADNFLTSE
jgi:hypothetical protein